MTDAVDVMLGFGPVSPSGRCLRTVYRAEAIAAGANIGSANPATAANINLGSFEAHAGVNTTNAMTDFATEPGRRATNGRDARRNEAVYFHPDHITIAVGDGANVVTTDFGQAKPHIKSIASIEASYGPCIGVSSTFGGHDIANIGAAPSAPTQNSGALVEDGVMKALTIKRFQAVMQTPIDGTISPISTLTEHLQVFLNGKGCTGLNGKPLVVDGKGFGQGIGKTNTNAALQQYLGTTKDGSFDSPKSSGIKALQHRLNTVAVGGF